MIIKYKKISESAHDPYRVYNSDACWDLCAHGNFPVLAGKWATIPTGLIIDIPNDYCGLIMSRSGLAAKTGMFVLNAPGVIDAGYAGELNIIVANMSDENWGITDGQRIAQLFIAPVEQHHLSRDDSMIIHSMRGSNGFGSTGY